MFYLFKKIFLFVKNNLHIKANPIGYARKIGVRVGENCRFLGVTTRTFGSEPFLVTIGDHVTITDGVRFITHDGGVWIFREDHPCLDIVSPICIGRNVFIGVGVIIMPGVEIGNNTVIGAGAVVTKSFDDNCIIAGVPARIIKTSDEYWIGVCDKSIPTRNMSEKNKVDYLREKFNKKCHEKE